MAINKICRKVACNRLVDPKQGKYCDKHKDAKAEDKRARNKYYDDNLRDIKSKQFYNSDEWKTLREVVKSKANGLCVKCLSSKRLRAGIIADHIVPIKVDWSLRLIESNIQFLCVECHNTKTAEDKRLYG